MVVQTNLPQLTSPFPKSGGGRAAYEFVHDELDVLFVQTFSCIVYIGRNEVKDCCCCCEIELLCSLEH